MTATVPNRSYYPALDGLRGVAILLVIFLHNFGFLNYFFFGWLGVDLFFVLSGFLITEILLNSLGGPHFLRNFYMRRVLRIFPVYYITIIIALYVLPSLFPTYVSMEYYSGNNIWLLTYLQNWLFVFKEPAGTNMLLHTWSLAVEEQFYLIWPLVILLVQKPKRLLVIALAALLLVGLARFAIWEYNVKNLAYASLYTFTRIDGLCIGAALAILMKINPEFLKKYTTLIVLLMAAINFGFYFLNGQYAFTLPYLALIGYTTFGILFGILVYEAVRDESKILRWILTMRILKFFGKISYGLYVYHWPVYVLLSPFFRKILVNRFDVSAWYAGAGSAVIVTAIAVVMSLISYHTYEKYFLKLKRKYA